MSSEYDTVVTICIGSFVNSAFAVAIIVVAVLLINRIQKEARAMEKATDTAFPAALRGLGFSEMPLDVVASLADNLKVPLEKVVKDYTADSAKRQWMTAKTFRDEELNKKFTSASKFVDRGYSESRNIKHS
ncbi:hypothetical protein AAVH_02704 [Aphelenchoides avenae]|nr:hypothetical protein AAVH_02704 [Aphelenchus avenae]